MISSSAEATGQGGSINIETERLTLLNGSQVLASTFGSGNAGNLTIRAGEINLAGISSRGEEASGLAVSVSLDATGNGGQMFIETGRLTIRDSAQILAATDSSGDGGDITIRASDIEISGLLSFIAASVDGEDVTGNGGNLTIDTGRLTVRDGAQISTSSFGLGDAGNLNITANQIELRGVFLSDREFIPSTIGAGTETSGQGGTLNINTERLSILDGAQISVSTSGTGDGGELNVRATEIELTGTGLSPEGASKLDASVQPGATGQGGILRVEAERLSVRDGAQISVSTFGIGNAGMLEIQATDVELSGNSSIGSTVEPQATGAGGILTLNAEQVKVGERSRISSSTFGSGMGGELILNTNDLLVVDGQVQAATFGEGQAGRLTIRASEISLDGGDLVTNTEGSGNSGTLEIITERLTARNAGQVSTGAGEFSSGNAGALRIQAEEIELTGTAQGFSSGIFASTDEGSTGSGSTINIETDILRVENEAGISVSSRGTGSAGNLIINAPSIRLNNEAVLTAETAAGNQGSIIVQTEDIRLRGNSRITTNATGVATGGNIQIDTDSLIALENSDISANAQQAFGGQIFINADAIFGTDFRTQQTNVSDITATSELGSEFSGTVELDTEADPSAGLIEFPQTVIDPAALIAQDPCKLRGDSEFIITGRGGIAPNPTQELTSIEGLVEWESFLVEPVTPPVNRSTQRRQQRTRKRDNNRDNHPVDSRTIIPARGWIRTEEGEVILVGYDPKKTGVIRQSQPSVHQCHSEE